MPGQAGTMPSSAGTVVPGMPLVDAPCWPAKQGEDEGISGTLILPNGLI